MRCSSGQIEEFKKNHIWLDMQDEFRVWLEQIHQQLENCDGELDHRELDRLSGNAQAIRNIEDILEVMINVAKSEEAENGRTE